MPQSNSRKLGITEGATVVAQGAPASTVTAIVGELPVGSTITDSADAPDLVLLFADDVDQVRETARAAYDRVRESGRLWIAYRKGARPLHRDTLQAELAPLGLDGVTLVSLDEVWSAMRVRERR